MRLRCGNYCTFFAIFIPQDEKGSTMLRKHGLAAATAVLVLLCLTVLLTSFSWPKQQELKSEIVDVPARQGFAGFQLADENSGQLWRKNVRSADGKFVKEQHVAYQDGRFGIFHFEQGRLVRFVGYQSDSNSPVIYEAEYLPNGLRIKSSRIYRIDGSLEQTYCLQADDVELRSWFCENGRDMIRKTETRTDGSQTETVWQNGVASVNETKAVEVDHKIGQRTAADGTTSAELIVTTRGTRVKAWWYFGSKDLLHTGRVHPDGTVEITVFTDTFKLAYRQYWRLAGEDWSRPFYRVKRLELFNEQTGKMSTEIDLQDDGVTVRQAISYTWSGDLHLRDEFDAKGYFKARSSYNTQTRNWQGRTEYPDSAHKVPLPKQLVEEPRNEKGRVFYRLGGVPFTAPADQKSAMFILP